MSGGARAVSLMLPLVATLAALHEDMDGAPRPLRLDEAFDGLDAANRVMVMDLFGSFDLDVLLVFADLRDSVRVGQHLPRRASSSTRSCSCAGSRTMRREVDVVTTGGLPAHG